MSRTFDRLTGDAFVPWKFLPRNSQFEPLGEGFYPRIETIAVVQSRPDPPNALKPAAGPVNESYSLKITQMGDVTISAPSSHGILLGLETLTQLFYLSSQRGQVYTPYAPVFISDSPKFPHRGLNLDVARNYYPPEDIKRTIEALSWNKFNRLHLHITDAQSWPLDIPALPELSRKGAYQIGLSYTPQDLADIQQFGALHGVEVTLEIDMPGHTAAIGLAYPDLITALNVQPEWNTYSAEPPTGQLKLNSPAVFDFLENLWNDLLPRVSAYSSYFHTGGDEVNSNAYLLDETVHSNDPAVLRPLLQKFIDFNHQHLRAAGLIPIVWEEQLLTWNLTLGPDVVVQAWLSDESVAQVVAKGHKVLAGNYNYWVKGF